MILSLPLLGALGLVGDAGAELSSTPTPDSKSKLWIGGEGEDQEMV